MSDTVYAVQIIMLLNTVKLFVTGDEKPMEQDTNGYVVPHCSTKWRELGLALGVTTSQLDIIHVDHPNSCEERCRVMLRKWLQQDPSATWGKLVDAIHSSTLSPSITCGGTKLLELS